MVELGKRVVLHVGAHKTGTTVLQQYLQAHPGALRRALICCPSRAELSPMIGWGERLVADPGQFGATLDAFRRRPWHRTLFVSHENMCGHPFVRRTPGLYPAAGPMIDVLRRLVGGLPTSVLLTIRPQQELLESYYLQSVNLGGHLEFAAWRRTVDEGDLSWRPLVDLLVAAFGADAVQVVDFGVIRQGTPAYLRHVLSRVGVDLEVDEWWSRTLNPSLSAQGLQMALAANRLLTPAQRPALRSYLQRHHSNASGPRPVLLDPAERASMQQRYGDEYAALVGAAAGVR